MTIKDYVYGHLRLPNSTFFVNELADRFGVKTVLDVGCGPRSPLRVLRPKLFTIGVDAFAPSLQEARQNRTHDQFLLADIAEGNLPVKLREIGYDSVDLVVLLDVIEHFTKRSALHILDICESLAAKYVLVKTPNGFIPQGPEFDNPGERHLSGWFPHDFEGLGYRVYGADGMKFMMGYLGGVRCRFAGASLINSTLAKLLRISSHPQHAFGLIAIKSIIGHPAILQSGLRNLNHLPGDLRYLP
jgi:SAM-dependent methyltransferase